MLYSSDAEAQRTYLCIDMKSFYASVECAERGLNPFETNLVVADTTRSENSICLAITPKMKSLGVKNRCRLRDIPKNIEYIAALPQMQLYIEYCADIYSIYLDYFSRDDIYVYSIDECFIDATKYLGVYGKTPKELAKLLIDAIAEKLHIPSTAGIGTNLYLAKIALDISAKHSKDHIGILTEESYRETLWDHRPITDFWNVGPGTARRLERYGITTMRGIANASQEFMYSLFGVNAELLIDHAWGREPCLIEDIKNYVPSSRSKSVSQILMRDYSKSEAETVLSEMILNGCEILMRSHVISRNIGVYVGYSKDVIPSAKFTVKLPSATSTYSRMRCYILEKYEQAVDGRYPIRRLALSFANLTDECGEGYDLFTDWERVTKERNLQQSVLEIKDRHGKNALMRGISYLPEATQIERNTYIGGHRSGIGDKSKNDR